MKSKASNNQINCATAKALARNFSLKTTVSQNDSAALKAHVANCFECKTDFALLQLFLDDRNAGLDELSSKRCRDAAIAHARNQIRNQKTEPMPSAPLPPPASLRPLVAIAIAAGLLTAVGVGIIVMLHRDNPETTVEPVAETSPTPMESTAIPPNSAPSDKTSQTEVVASGEDSTPSKSLLNPASGVLVYTEENTLVSIAKRTEDRLTLDLQTGAIWVDVNPKISHPAVTVETPDGAVHVTGTVFRVANTKRFVVQVLRGEVAVQNAQGNHPVKAGYESNIGSNVVNAIDADLQETLTASWIQRIDNKRSAFSVKTAPDDPSSSAATADAPHRKPVPSFDSVISTARKKKAKSDFVGAIESYQKLIRNYPSKPETKAALVTVGHLYLKMGNAPQAEKMFRQYQTQGNTLLGPEALQGEIDALRMQKKTADELNALKLFSRLYPQSLHMHRVKKRIAEIESAQ